MQAINKQEIQKKILEKIAQEAETLKKAALLAHDYATDSESKAEDKYDTRSLEASYLAAGHSKLAAETYHTLTLYQSLTFRNFSPHDPIALTALVELECQAEHTLYLIGPKNGGMTIEYQKRPILVITPTSLLGKLLIGKQEGDSFEMKHGHSMREYEIISVR